MKEHSNNFIRAAGVLLPVSSLPSPYGIGAFGAAARRWVNFLCAAGQRYWQVLPLGPTGFGDSPYQSFSAFAGNPYFIDLDTLREDGLLELADYADIEWGHSREKVDYGAVYRYRESVLRKAYTRFGDSVALDAYVKDNPWLESYAVYMTIKSTQGNRAWTDWDIPLRKREQAAMERVISGKGDDIGYHCFVQYEFYKQWESLRRYANDKGVQIIGDIPIYAAMDSADVWANPTLFQLDDNAAPIEVSGCPPDSFSSFGQLWGNPLYDWAEMARTGYGWWIQRIASSFALYDVLRIDHFRGLESFYAIPGTALTAENGIWKPGPGMKLINAIHEAVPQARIIAEDLGFLTDNVRRLVRESGYPSMKVLQFAFDTREDSDYSPFSYRENAVVYPGTHDNDTVKGWGKSAPEACVLHAMEYLGISRRSELPRAMIRLAMQSAPATAIVLMSDWLNLGSAARLNTPSTIGKNNWRWRMREDEMTSQLAADMARMTRLYGR